MYAAAGLWFLSASVAIRGAAISESGWLYYFFLFPVVLVARSASHRKRVANPVARILVALVAAVGMIVSIVGTWGAAAPAVMAIYVMVWSTRLGAVAFRQVWRVARRDHAAPAKR
ncbi:MAG: hypothetical protein ACKVUT_11920 [Gaiella sp.]